MNPLYPYTESDQLTWRRFFEAMEKVWQENAAILHPWYRKHVHYLARFRERIPSLPELNEVLAPIGWRAQHVEGLAPAWDIAQLLHQRIMPVSRSIRAPEQIFFANEPDLIHDIFGHLPSLFDPEYRALLRRWTSRAASFPISEMDRASYHLNKQIVQSEGRVPKETLDFLHQAVTTLQSFTSRIPSPTLLYEKIYFWCFEFGIVKHADQIQVLGAGLLTSLSELKKFVDGDIKIKALDVETVLAPYHIATEQDLYHAVSHTDAYEGLIVSLEERMKAHLSAPERTYAYG